MAYFYTPEESVELLRAAIAEIKGRILEGDTKSAAALCEASEIVLMFGCESAEFKAHFAIQQARFA